MNALYMLRKMLDEAKIPYESYQEKWSELPHQEAWSELLYTWDGGEGTQWLRNQIIYGRYGEHDWKLDAIFQYGSWGREDNCVETYGDLGVDEYGDPRAMSAEEVFTIIKEDWDKMKGGQG